MKKKLALLLLTPLLFGCDELDIVADERLFAEGFVTTEAGSPIGNIDVSIAEDSGILGQDVTDASGAFSFVSLKSSDPVMQLRINHSTDSLLSRLTYIAFDTSIEDYSVNESTLFPVGYLTINLTKSTSSAPNLLYSVAYKETFCERLLSGINPDQPLRCYDSVSLSDELGDNGNTVTFNLRSLRTSPVVFRYRIGEDGEENTVEIPLNNSNTTYEFEY